MHSMMKCMTVAVAIVVGGCAATQEARWVKQSGFLGDYSMLQEGKRGFVMEGSEDQALYIYKNPAADWRKYKKVVLDPVTVWIGEDSQLAKVPGEDRQRLANALWAQLHDALKKDYEIVTDPAPDAMRLQAAITEADKSMVVLDTVSSLYPQARVVAGMKSAVTGVSAFTGSASGELKVTDSQTGMLLVAAVDRRGGTKNLSGMFNSWNDVEESYRFWAEKIRYRACQWRGGTDCQEPKA